WYSVWLAARRSAEFKTTACTRFTKAVSLADQYANRLSAGGFSLSNITAAKGAIDPTFRSSPSSPALRKNASRTAAKLTTFFRVTASSHCWRNLRVFSCRLKNTPENTRRFRQQWLEAVTLKKV